MLDYLQRNYDVYQIGRTGEEALVPKDKLVFDLKMKDLLEFSKDMHTFISVDNFFPHFCNYYKLPSGIVLFSKSDPNVFGYPQNTNLLKDRKYLRSDQYGWWSWIGYDVSAFISPDQITKYL